MMGEIETASFEVARFGREGLPCPLAVLYDPLGVQTVAPGTILFREDEKPNGVYVLRSGEVDLVQDRTGREARIDTARPDRILGLSAVLTFRNHHSTAVARTRAELSFIPEADLQRLVDEHPAIWFALLHQLSQDVMHTYDVIRRDFWRKSATPGRRSSQR